VPEGRGACVQACETHTDAGAQAKVRTLEDRQVSRRGGPPSGVAKRIEATPPAALVEVVGPTRQDGAETRLAR